MFRGRGRRARAGQYRLAALRVTTFSHVRCGAKLDVPSDSLSAVWKALASMLHLGNAEFVDEDTDAGAAAVVKQREPLSNAAVLLGVDLETLEKVSLPQLYTGMICAFAQLLTTEVLRVKMRGDTIRKSVNAANATLSRDGVAQARNMLCERL